MDIAHEEVFGPIICVFKVANNDDGEAVRIANSTGYALGGSVHSANSQRQKRSKPTGIFIILLL